jgi:uncharacterized protein
MSNLDEIKEIIRSNQQKIQEEFKVEKIGIFGSYVRGEQKGKSDIDILVEFRESVDFFEYLDLEDYLGKILGKKVDLVMKQGLKPLIGECILKEVQYID